MPAFQIASSVEQFEFYMLCKHLLAFKLYSSCAVQLDLVSKIFHVFMMGWVIQLKEFMKMFKRKILCIHICINHELTSLKALILKR